MKFLIICFITLTQMINASNLQLFHDDYDHKTNSEVVKDLANIMHKFLIENKGSISMGMHEDLVAVSSLTYPPTLRYVVRIDLEGYRSDIIQASKKSNVKNIYKRVHSEKFNLWLKSKLKENSILRSCTKVEQRYMLDRGIGLDTEFWIKDKGRAVFSSVEITLNDCNDTEAKERLLKSTHEKSIPSPAETMSLW